MIWGGYVKEFSVEYYTADNDEENTKLSALYKKDIEKWKIDMETRALTEYYNRKIKIEQKIWF